MLQNIFNIITVTGPDSFKFLQSQITADIAEIDKTPKIPRLSAYCNRQGRVISVFYVIKESNDHYVLLTIGNTGEKLNSKIKKYAVFSKIEIKCITDIKDYAAQLDELKNNYELDLDSNFYFTHKIPILTELLSEQYLPDNLNLLELNAVSLKKGCFLGQEIIARVYYKGKTKKKLYLLEINNISTESKTILDKSSGNTAGEIIYSNNNQALAVLDEQYFNHELIYNNSDIRVIA